MKRDSRFRQKYDDFIHDATDEIKQEKKDICVCLMGLGLNKKESIDLLRTALAHLLINDVTKDAKHGKGIVLNSSFKGLVSRTAKNIFLRKKIQSNNQKEWGEKFNRRLKNPDSLETQLYRQEEWELIKKKFSAYVSDELQRYVICEYYFEGKSYQQIQEDLAVMKVHKTISNLRKIKQKGLEKLRKNIQKTILV